MVLSTRGKDQLCTSSCIANSLYFKTVMLCINCRFPSRVTCDMVCKDLPTLLSITYNV
ncbi:hypothetical protein BABINDRAFT_121290 [Babjeviella inositovora NRRL Y-12698]|uniref:Uncharacterized protein n=1 Tax=Babjeviella inositovora NRRL Y-12698 TaxID=984486 RepID=A0A1E3QUG3_9ASCO|nr:uncharacterized protein BABINDRAFT_121290 [Babjeviella inositovora NRRL Y-12698]ODQ81214.1 hypothetical protein BABINDRAFT_121290 [Babjeviella inositovora NRRL Y-12698]